MLAATRRCAVLLPLVASGAQTPAAPGGAEGAALRVPDRRDRFRSGADLRSLLAHAHREHLRGAATATNLSPGRCACVRCTAVALPEARRRLQDLHDPRPARASTSPTTRPSRASGASSSPPDYVYSIKRHFDPRWKSPHLSRPRRTTGSSASTSCARPRSRRQARSTTTARSRAARARPLHAAVQARRAATRASPIELSDPAT